MRFESQEHFEARRLGLLPTAWARRMGDLFGRKKAEGEAAANLWLLDQTEPFERLPIPVYASDGDIVAIADRQAGRMFEILAGLGLTESAAQREALGRNVARYGIAAPDGPGVTDSGAVARMLDPLWWRRQLRRVHARELEAKAISLGYVHAGRLGKPYCSDETLARRQGQRARNAETLEGVEAINEHGESYTLAKLAELSVSNPRIKRGELMTRIRGFEEVAAGLGHAAEFWTLTCPSRMHARRHDDGRQNFAFDGTTPRQAQQYLARVWARIRAALDRRGVKLYGFRIAEPHHDGTPHWHLLMWFAPRWPGAAERAAMPRIRAIVRRYALADSGTETGAKKYRFKPVAIDATKGTAAGYVAKYVAKNIDGYMVGEDMFGGPALEASQRVEAWASTWGIRQFQQVGGPPVGVWRELRRMREAVEPATVEAARISADVGNWRRYVEVMGGPLVRRECLAVHVGYAPGRRINPNTGEIGQGARNRYGEALAVRVWGLIEAATERAVKAVRHLWRIVSKAGAAAVRFSPWTCVNNCTGGLHGGYQVGDGAVGGAGVGRGKKGKSIGAAAGGGRDFSDSGGAADSCG